MTPPGPPTVFIIAAPDTPRVRYAFRVLLEVVLEWRIQFLNPTDPLPDFTPLIFYGAPANPYPEALFLPACGALGPAADASEADFWRFSTGPEGFDPLAGAFFLTTLLGWTRAPQLDAHKRFLHSAYFPFPEGLAGEPLVHKWAIELASRIQSAFPEAFLPLPPPPPALFTIDIDAPWKYLHKSMSVSTGAVLKDLLKIRFDQLCERIHVYRTRKDPFDNFSLLKQALPPAQTCFFFLIERRSRHDSRFTWRQPALRDWILRVRDAGFRCGVHPSYRSAEKPEWLAEEIARFSEILGEPVIRSRQHYLRFFLPDTFRRLAALGIEEEHSLCPIAATGFICGMAKPFPWYDTEAEQESTLWLHPSQAMDRGLMQYEGLAPQEAMHRMKSLADSARKFHGRASFLMHNDAWSESEKWKGWREPVTKLAAMLSDK